MPKKLEGIDAIDRQDAVEDLEGQAIREIRQDILGLQQKKPGQNG